MVDGVDQQVADGPLQHQPVALDRQILAFQFELQVLGQDAVVIHQLAAQVHQAERLLLRDDQAMLGLGEKQHVGDHARQPLVFLQAGGQQVAVFVAVARLGQRHLGLHAQGVERRAQFVGEVGGKVGQALEGFLQPAEHGVEGADQFGQLGRHVRLRDAFGELPGGNAAGRRGNRPHRLHAAACHNDADDHRQ